MEEEVEIVKKVVQMQVSGEIKFKVCSSGILWQREGYPRLDFLVVLGLGGLSKVNWDLDGELCSLVKEFLENYNGATKCSSVQGRPIHLCPSLISGKLQMPNEGIDLMQLLKKGASTAKAGCFRLDMMEDKSLSHVLTLINEVVLLEGKPSSMSACLLEIIQRATNGEVFNWSQLLYKKMTCNLAWFAFLKKFRGFKEFKAHVSMFAAAPLIAHLLKAEPVVVETCQKTTGDLVAEVEMLQRNETILQEANEALRKQNAKLEDENERLRLNLEHQQIGRQIAESKVREVLKQLEDGHEQIQALKQERDELNAKLLVLRESLSGHVLELMGLAQ